MPKSLFNVPLFSFGGIDPISVLMIGSFRSHFMGIAYYTCRLPNKVTNPGLGSLFSLVACATAISFQVIYGNLMIRENNIAGLMHTSVVSFVVMLLGVGRLFLEEDKKR